MNQEKFLKYKFSITYRNLDFTGNGEVHGFIHGEIFNNKMNFSIKKIFYNKVNKR